MKIVAVVKDTQMETFDARSVSRPTLEWEEWAVESDNGVAYMAGQHRWNPITVVGAGGLQQYMKSNPGLELVIHVNDEERWIIPNSWLLADGTEDNFCIVFNHARADFGKGGNVA